MRCMKCGVEIAQEQAFCEKCLAGMEKHPIRQDTPVILPPKAFAPAPRHPAPHRRPRRPEEQVARLRLQVRLLLMLCAGMAIALALCGSYLLRIGHRPIPQPPDPGQNYSTGPISPYSSGKIN